jgi:predicted transcriptional regulator
LIADKSHLNLTSKSDQWWETAEDHRFALEVLQLKVRRDIMKTLASGPKPLEDITKEFDLKESQAEYHLALLEKALVLERSGEGYGLTLQGSFTWKRWKPGAEFLGCR